MNKSLIVRNKNAILELLKGECKFEKIQIVVDLDQDELTQKIMEQAAKDNVSIEVSAYEKMPKRREGEGREVIVGYVIPNNEIKLNDLIDEIYSKKETPFFVLVNRVEFKNNIGIIARTAFAAGVNGIIYQGDDDEFINEETIQYSIGTIARIPIVKMGIFEALKELKRNDIKTFCTMMTGQSIYKTRLTGAVAIVLGAEDKGISEDVAHKCDEQISIPMKVGLDSLNVGISAGIVMYEKVRQDLFL